MLRSAGQLAGARGELDRLLGDEKTWTSQEPPRTNLERLFCVDYRAVEQEYNEVLVLLASEENESSRIAVGVVFFGYTNSCRQSTGKVGPITQVARGTRRDFAGGRQSTNRRQYKHFHQNAEEWANAGKRGSICDSRCTSG